MRKKKVLALVLSVAVLVSSGLSQLAVVEASEPETENVVVENSEETTDGESFELLESEREVKATEDKGVNEEDNGNEEKKASELSDGNTADAVAPDEQVEIIASGESGGLTWSIDSEGNFKLEGEGDCEIKKTTNVLSYGTFYAYSTPWSSQKEKIKTAQISVKEITSLAGLFYDCINLVSVDFMDSDFSKVTDTSFMFKECLNLQKLDLSNFDTSQVTDMNHMFFGCEGLQELDLSNFNTSQVKDMNYMFFGCSNLQKLDVSGFNTSQVTDMSWMFRNDNSLQKLDLTNFDTSQVTNMSQMFYNCHNLQKLDVSKFDTSRVTDISGMFSGCNSLQKLDVSKFDTSQVTGMGNMFSECNSLQKLDLSSFNTSQVTYMGNMFSKCNSLLELDVSKFDTSQVTNMRYMFYKCHNLQKLDLSGFNVSQDIDMDEMFSECGIKNIKTPCNVKVEVLLPLSGEKEYWEDDNGNVYTMLPMNQSSSITLTRVNGNEHKHNYKQSIVKATTTKNGSIVNACTDCGETNSTVIYYPKTISLSKTSYVYDGKVKKPTVTVKGSDGKLISPANYSVSYANGCKNVGQYKVTIKFKGNYSGSVKKTFNILPKGTTISKVSGGKKSITVKWKKADEN